MRRSKYSRQQSVDEQSVICSLLWWTSFSSSFFTGNDFNSNSEGINHGGVKLSSWLQKSLIESHPQEHLLHYFIILWSRLYKKRWIKTLSTWSTLDLSWHWMGCPIDILLEQLKLKRFNCQRNERIVRKEQKEYIKSSPKNEKRQTDQEIECQPLLSLPFTFFVRLVLILNTQPSWYYFFSCLEWKWEKDTVIPTEWVYFTPRVRLLFHSCWSNLLLLLGLHFVCMDEHRVFR